MKLEEFPDIKIGSVVEATIFQEGSERKQVGYYRGLITTPRTNERLVTLNHQTYVHSRPVGFKEQNPNRYITGIEVIREAQE